MIYIYSWNIATVTTTQMMRRSINMENMEIYQLISKPIYNMLAIIQNFSVNKIQWKYIMIKLHTIWSYDHNTEQKTFNL